MAKIIAIVVAFLVVVVLMGFLAADINGIDLTKDEGEMSEQEFIKYGMFRPMLLPARLVARLFRKR